MAARNGPINLTLTSVVSAQAVDSASPEKNVLEDLRNENQILRTLLRHQELIEDLVEVNASLRHMLQERVELQVAEASLEVKGKFSASREFRGDPMCTASKSHINGSSKKNLSVVERTLALA
ncbi:hypothetical protein R1flu_013120 [Riccia fluitans]|uniref:Uncharacterized protein n=1 Tax=Riccia fluitans TaxID=41844 RepID=A0ABD1ZCV3_9MARC